MFLYLYKNTSSHYSFSILIDGTPYFVGIIEDVDSHFVRESSVGSLLNIFLSLTTGGGGYLIRFDQISGPRVQWGF